MQSDRSWSGAFPGTLGGITEAAGWIEALAAEQGFPEDVTFGIQICVEELLANVVRHGGGGWPAAGETERDSGITMSVSIRREGDEITVTVEDNGRPFDTAAAPPKRVAAPLEEAVPGGLGIQLIKQFSSGLSYDRADGRNRTRLKFLWPGPANSLV